MKKLLVIACMILSGELMAQTDTLRIDLEPDEQDGDSMYESFSGNVLMEIPASGLERFTIETGAGELKIVQTNLPLITVEAEVSISASDAVKAKQFVDRDLELSLERTGKEAILRSFFDYEQEKKNGETISIKEFFQNPYRVVNLRILVPSGVRLDIDDNSGDIILTNLMNDIDLVDGSGYIYLNGVDGDITINDNSGDILVKNINQNTQQTPRIKIIDNSGDLKLENVRGYIDITDASGDIVIGGIKGSVAITDASGEIRIQDLDGDLDINDNSGDIRSRDIAGDVTISDNAGGIYVRKVLLNVHIKNAGSGDLVLEEIAGKITGDLRKLHY